MICMFQTTVYQFLIVILFFYPGACYLAITLSKVLKTLVHLFSSHLTSLCNLSLSNLVKWQLTWHFYSTSNLSRLWNNKRDAVSQTSFQQQQDPVHPSLHHFSPAVAERVLRHRQEVGDSQQRQQQQQQPQQHRHPDRQHRESAEPEMTSRKKSAIVEEEDLLINCFSPVFLLKKC